MEVYRLINYLKNLFKGASSSKNQSNTDEKTHLLKESLDENIDCFKEKFKKSADLTIRQINIESTRGAIITIEGMVDKNILANSVTTPIMQAVFKDSDPKEKYKTIRDNVLSSSEQVQVTTYEEAFKFIMSGFAVIAVDGNNCMIAIGVQGFSYRSISEPTTEVMQRGSREGFVEPIKINMTLIRRRIKNPELKFESMTVGTVSKTDIALCYLTDTVSPQILSELKKRIKKIDLQTVLAAGYISPYLEECCGLSIFSSVGLSERPDTVCAKISEGRIAIIIDGTPNVIIVPYLFVEYFQTMDDYLIRPYFATLIRWIKYIAFLVSIILPGLYVAIGTFNPELFPESLITKVAKSVSATPLPLLLETIAIYFMYEVMREAGLRLPRPLGHAVSIVGALVIGETAINAGLVAAPTLMFVALSAISSYAIPSLYEPIAFLRLVFILAGGIIGIWGIVLAFSALLVNICSKNNFGVPFFAPVSPFSLSKMRDVAMRCGWKTLAKKNNTIQSMPGSSINTRRD